MKAPDKIYIQTNAGEAFSSKCTTIPFRDFENTEYIRKDALVPDNLDEAAMEIVIKMHPCMEDCTILGDRLTRGQLMALVKAGAEWMANQMPMPEDTVLFQKGVEEGRRLEKDDLALSIDDIEKIHVFLYAVKNNKQGAFTFTRLSDEQYKEVLQRFKNLKNK